MNFKKAIILAISFMCICVPAIPTTKVQALPSAQSEYWLKPRKMKVVKNQRISLINGNTVGYKQRPIKNRTLKKGSVVTVRQAASWPWIFIGNIPGVGKSSKNGYFWVNMNHSTTWLKGL